MALALYCFFFVYLLGSRYNWVEGSTLLFRTLDALTRALHYMQEQVLEINLDAVVAVRQVEEQLQAFLLFAPDVFQNIHHWVEVLRDKAKRIADEGMQVVSTKDPQYASAVGVLMSKSRKLLWYQTRNTSEEYVEVPVPCSTPDIRGLVETTCFSQLTKSRNAELGCAVSAPCIKFNSDKKQRGYALTHQVFFWEFMEMRQCVDRVSEQVQVRLCSNVMRDASRTSRGRYPKSHEDLFMEQIGFCGLWGFRDFNRQEWLEKIFEWQQPSGCYIDQTPYRCFDELERETEHVRVKREEEILSDGCLSHKTAVAVLALVVNVRFEAEKAYEEFPKDGNRLNKFLI